MSLNISGSQITFPDGSVQGTAPNGFKNRIINGAMVIDQRNAGASVTGNDDVYGVDRFKTIASQSSKLTVQQNQGSVTTPNGFSKYLGYTSSSAYSVAAGDYFALVQHIEGFNTSDLMWGTANAQTVTLSFWVRSSLTGTFGGSFTNSAQNRSYPFTYTISAANTWEQKSITVAGDTTGTWIGATNGRGISVFFSLGMGSNYSGTAGSWAGSAYYSATGGTSVVGTNGATFYITGVQLEKGSAATSFDYRPYGTELQLCQRYYEVVEKPLNVLMSCYNASSAYGGISWCVSKRATPTVTMDTTVSNWNSATLFANNGGRTFTSISVNNTSITNIQVIVQSSSTFTGGQVGHIDYSASNGAVRASAEL